MKNKSILAALLGIVFEGYSNTLFGFFAVILASQFFPSNELIHPYIGGFGAFAVGFLGKPLGGIIFGNIGDKYGRKIALAGSIFLTSLSTLGIAFLPNYSSIGISASILLILLRFFHGFSASGDYTGAVIYVAEQRGINNKTFQTCLLVSLGFLGAIVALCVSILTVSSLMPENGWRLSFIVGGIFGLFIFVLRLRMDESRSFLQVKKEKLIDKLPIISAFKHDKKALIATCILGGANLVPLYLATFYINVDLKLLLHYSSAEILFNNLYCYLFTGILVLLSYKLIETYGSAKVMRLCMLWFIVGAYPVYYWAYLNPTSYSLVTLQAFLLLGDAPQIASLIYYMPSLFPTERRYSGIGFSYATGQALIGGTTPILASWFVHLTEKAWSPCYILILASISYLLAIRLAEKSKR